MTEKNKKKISYAVVCSAIALLAYGAHEARLRKAENPDATIASIALPPQKKVMDWTPNETVTGTILAANFAQNQRDWALADTYLERLTDPKAEDPRTAQRMMLLAVSAGQFDRAADYAARVRKGDDAATADDKSMEDGRDLASLVLVAQSVRAGDFAGAESELTSLHSQALKAFVQPVLINWIKAGQSKTIDAGTEGLSLLQLLHKGLAAEWAGQKDTANKVFDALADVPLTPAGAMTVAAYDIRNGRIEPARTVLNKSLRQNPENQEAKKILDALNQGQTPDLRPDLSYHMHGVTAGVAMAFRDLAQMMFADGAADSALVFAQMGRMIRADVPSLSILAGNIFADEKRYDDAASAYLSVQSSEPDYTDAQIRLSELRAEQGKNAEAAAILESLISGGTAPDARVAYALGELYRADKQNKKAVDAFDRALKNDRGELGDDLWSVYFVRGMAYDDLGQWGKAEADLRKALDLRPKNPHVLNYLAYSWADHGINLDEARTMLLGALAQRPTDPFITDSLGWVYYRQGKFKDASLLLERAVSLKPYDAVMNDHLGDVYEKTGRSLEAQYQWRRALEQARAEKDDKLVKSLQDKLAGKAGAVPDAAMQPPQTSQAEK